MSATPDLVIPRPAGASVTTILEKGYKAKAVVPEYVLAEQPSAFGAATSRWFMQAEDGKWHYVIANDATVLVRLEPAYDGPEAEDAYLQRELGLCLTETERLKSALLEEETKADALMAKIKQRKKKS